MMKKLTEKCEDFLMSTLTWQQRDPSPLKSLDLFYVAQEYRLERLQDACVNQTEDINFWDLTKHSMYDKVNFANYRKIIEGIIQKLELDTQKLLSEQRALQNEVRKL